MDVSDNEDDYTRQKKTSKPVINKTQQTPTTNKYKLLENTLNWDDDNIPETITTKITSRSLPL